MIKVHPLEDFVMNRMMRLYFNFTELLGIDVKIYFAEQKHLSRTVHYCYASVIVTLGLQSAFLQ